MPQDKIDARRIRDHFRRLWLVYLIGAVLLCFLNHLVYTVTRPGYSDDETLCVLMLNVETGVAEADILAAVAPAGFRDVQLIPLAAVEGDPSGGMLVNMRLTDGRGDLCISDAHGLEILAGRNACLPLESAGDTGLAPVRRVNPETGLAYTAALQTEDGRFLSVIANGTDTESALAALGALAGLLN